MSAGLWSLIHCASKNTSSLDCAPVPSLKTKVFSFQPYYITFFKRWHVQIIRYDSTERCLWARSNKLNISRQRAVCWVSSVLRLLIHLCVRSTSAPEAKFFLFGYQQFPSTALLKRLVLKETSENFYLKLNLTRASFLWLWCLSTLLV